MIEPRLRYRYDLHYERSGAGKALLIDEHTVHVLEGELFTRLLPLLDGRLTADDIVDRLPDVGPATVYYTLDQLQRRGLVVEACEAPLGEAAFWSALGTPAGEAVGRLAAAGVAVRAAGADLGPMEAALRSVGLGDGDDLVVWVVDDYLRPEVTAWNREADRPWMVVKPVGMEVWMGPLFRPGAAPCHACLAHRLAHHRQVQQVVLRGRSDLGVLPTSLAALPPLVEASCRLAAAEVARFVAGAGTRLEDRVVSLDTRTLQTREHALRPWSACPVCGAGRAAPASCRVELQPSMMTFFDDGGFRTVSPERTLERLADLVSPITGIVPVLQRRARDAEGLISACVSGFNQAFPVDDFGRLRQTMRLITAGKGKSDAQARASALAEAVERYCGAFHGDEPRRRARLAELGSSARHPHDLMLFSERQYAAATRRTFNAVPAPFDEDVAIDWTPAWSLTRDEECWLPTAFCYVGYDPDARLCGADSNGNAAGNTLEEAVLQGLLELCERDAVALWWYNRVRRPGLDLASVQDPYVLRLRDGYRAMGRDLWVLDITPDLGVPSYAAVSRRMGEGPQEIVLGFGAHLDARLAVLRAMTEINQFVSGPPTAEVQRGVDLGVDAWLDATVARETYLLPEGEVPVRRVSWSADLRENVEALHGVLRQAGLELIVLDQSRPDIDLRVVKVVVPGLRHFWERFAPGRLYDVPVRLGWRSSPTPEDDLNPLRMFL